MADPIAAIAPTLRASPRGHPKVALVVTNRSWEADIEARRIAEGRHRGLLLQTAREHLQFDWKFCFDANERVTGDLRGYN